MSEQRAVLVVDDDVAVARVLTALLHQANLQARHVGSAEQALADLERRPADLVITDLRMSGMDGMQLLAESRSRWPEIPVVMISAHGTVPLAVEAMKAGASDFILKPFDREELLFVVRKALRNDLEKAEPGAQPEGMIGESLAMNEANELIRRAAAGSASVLIRGESGTGKELAARALHALGPRRSGPFIKVHCGALPDALLESELFGYEKGAFTGAATRKPGRVELAEGGTLFLDEIGDITPAVQVKLLRILQDRQFERLGGTQTLSADVRFVAATHRPLEEMVQRGEFREDLFYRLNVVPIWMPPLRSRPDDIERLANGLCAALGRANGRPGASLDPAAIRLLEAQAWPGNVRQLQNFIERLVVLSDQQRITSADVERELRRQSAPSVSSGPVSGPVSGPLDARKRETERAAIEEALKRSANNRSL
ncbi:MAG: sigma-54 dependent transcriptional regulator, partial [Myxococcaceae bacterium]